jgi:hypothetical protein
MSQGEQEAGRVRILPHTVDASGKVTLYSVVAPAGFQWDNGDHLLAALTLEEARGLAVRERLSPCPNDCICKEEV